MANCQTSPPSIVRNGYAIGEHAVFRFDGKFLNIRHGNDRSGLGFETTWYALSDGTWHSIPAYLQPPTLPRVHLGKCDPEDTTDISNRFPQYRKLLARGSKLKYVGVSTEHEKDALAIYSRPGSQSQTGKILEIALVRDGQAPVVLAIAKLGEARYCRAQWNEDDRGRQDLVVFTLEPAGSSANYAFQSFTIGK
jgi:hypothetical protein